MSYIVYGLILTVVETIQDFQSRHKNCININQKQFKTFQKNIKRTNIY